MIEAFLIKPFFAIILIAISCSLLGVFVLWKKLSYFGDALSHSILLGLACGAIFATNQVFALIFFAIIFACLFGVISQNRYFSKDSIIMILSYFCVAMAMIINDIWIKNFSFSNYAFGDILTVGNQDILALFLITILAIFYTIFAFRKILLICVNQDLARIDGVKVEFWKILFLVLLSLAIALSVRIIGVFLMTALLVLPAAISRIFAASPKAMMFLSLIFGVGVSASSFMVATHYNLTISSTIIAIFSMIFLLSLLIKNYLKS